MTGSFIETRIAARSIQYSSIGNFKNGELLIDGTKILSPQTGINPMIVDVAIESIRNRLIY